MEKEEKVRHAVHAAFSGLSMPFYPDIRSFAEDSERLVTEGMEAAGVLAICLTWHGIRYFI